MATSLMAVGSVSILIVLASAAGYANERQGRQRLTQVLDEARNDARASVNVFRPREGRKVPGDEEGQLDEKVSALFPGYRYELAFALVDTSVPESGYDVLVTVRYGDEQSHQERVIVGSDTVPDEEFERSLTYEQERKGGSNEGGRETR